MDGIGLESPLESVFVGADVESELLLGRVEQIHSGSSREFIEDARQLETGIKELVIMAGETAVIAGVETADPNIDGDLPVNSVNYALPAITFYTLNEDPEASFLARLKALSGLYLNPRNIPEVLHAINGGDLNDYYFEVLYRPHSKIDYWRMAFPLQYVLTHSTPSDGVTTPNLKERMQDLYPSIFQSDYQVVSSVNALREIPLVKQDRQGRAYAYWGLDEFNPSEAQEVFTDRFSTVRDTVGDHTNRYYTVPDENEAEDQTEGDDDKPQMKTLCQFE